MGCTYTPGFSTRETWCLAPSSKLQAASNKLQASSAKLLKVQAASVKPRATSVELQAASDKLQDLVSFIKFHAARGERLY
jgi:hypothetical protein